MYPTSINDRYLDDVVEILRDGGLIIYPTDTFYAVGCNALNNAAVERVCRLKGIDPKRQNLSIVCADISQASEYARIDNTAYSVIHRNLPGPFTFLLPASTRLPKIFKGRKIVGVRVPDNAIARAIADRLGAPLLSTSVEKIDGETVTDPFHIGSHYEGQVDVMIDGGEGGDRGSAIVDLTDSHSPEILRDGPLPLA